MTDFGTEEKPITLNKDDMAKIIILAGKVLDENNVPKEGRIIYNPETDSFVKMPEETKYSVTRGNNVTTI